MYGIAQTNTFKFLSTLSLRRATNCKYAAYVRYGISIHALLAESDQRGYEGEYAEPSISIHALLAESDALRLKMPRLPSNFYPRSPCGERLGGCVVGNWRLAIFLSTLSLRRATDKENPRTEIYIISIHALLAESDGKMKFVSV